MNKNVLLICGLLLVGIGLIKPNFSNIVPNKTNVLVSVAIPSDSSLEKEAEDIVTLMKNSGSATLTQDSAQLRDLYINFANMVGLEGKDVVISTTDEIRKANSISGNLLQVVGLNLRGKYENLAKECEDVIVVGIGKDNIALSPELRKKAAESFMALAWAFDIVSK